MGLAQGYIERLLTWYFDLLPVPDSFRELVGRKRLPALVTQSSSVVISAVLASFARRLGLHLEPVTSLKGRTPAQDTLYMFNMHHPSEVGELLKNEQLTTFSTLNIFRGKGPVWNHPSYTMKLLDFVVLLLGPIFHHRFLLIIFGEPVTFRHDGETSSVHRTTREIKLDFYRNLKLVRGTPFQRFSIQEQIVLGGQDYERTLRKLAKSLGTSRDQLHRQAKRAFRLIAARPRAWFFIPAAVIVQFILKRLFTDIQVRGLPEFSQALKKDSIVLVPMHRSHLDYILIGKVLYDANLNPPVIAAGVNLSFWPAGSIIRTLGGYFVKRNAKQDRLHALVLRRYVNYLVKRGHLQEFFIEGGRSRSGRMRPPKLGLLKTMVTAYVKKERKDVLFVPVSISYEHVIEDSEYAKENTGSEKTKETLLSLFRARKMLRQKYKEVIIHFGEGIRFSSFREQFVKNARGKTLPGEEHGISESGSSALIEHLAIDISRKIEGQTSIGLRSLTYLSLFLSPTYGLTRAQLQSSLRKLARAADWYREMEGNKSYALPTPALERFLESDNSETHDFYSAGVTFRTTILGEEVYFIPGSVRYTADFYKNSVAHVYLPLGLLSLLFAVNRPLHILELRPYFEVLQKDLLLPSWDKYQAHLSQYINILKRQGILTSLSDEYGEQRVTFSDDGLEFLCPGLLLPYFQCLLYIYRLFQTEEYAERVGNQEHRSSESSSQSIFQNTPTLKKSVEGDVQSAPTTWIKRVYDYGAFIKSAQQQLKFSKYHGTFTRTEISSISTLTSTLESLSARGIITFQERYGKRSTITLECLPEEEILLLEQTERMLLSAMRSHQMDPKGLPSIISVSGAPSFAASDSSDPSDKELSFEKSYTKEDISEANPLKYKNFLQ